VWIAVTYLTRPTDQGTLVKFYELVRPAGPGWAPIRAVASPGGSPDRLPLAMLGWVIGCLFVYSGLFGVGSFLYGRMPQAATFAVLFVASGIGLLRLVPRLWAGQAATS